jgi:hypothetical protein
MAAVMLAAPATGVGGPEAPSLAVDVTKVTGGLSVVSAVVSLLLKGEITARLAHPPSIVVVDKVVADSSRAAKEVVVPELPTRSSTASTLLMTATGF